jgi:tRNA A-37 threonylcarbamoyl transferase component Bud32
MSPRADLLEYADVLDFSRQVLGPCELEQDFSWAHGMSAVLRLRDAGGVIWFAKRHRERDRHEAEVTAYRQWVPALGSHAPRLHAVDDLRSAIIVSAIPGEPVPWPAADLSGQPGIDRLAEQALQREAGVLLRRFHDAQPPLPWGDLGAAKIAEFDGLMPMASQLLARRDLAFAQAEIETLSGLPCPGQVPCHRDYTPRNWLVNDGVQYVIDFEHARLDVWLADLARLHLGIWPDRPDLKKAFLDGYGRQLSDTDHAILQGVAALTATWLVVKAREIRQPALEDAFRAALQRLHPAGPRDCGQAR